MKLLIAQALRGPTGTTAPVKPASGNYVAADKASLPTTYRRRSCWTRIPAQCAMPIGTACLKSASEPTHMKTFNSFDGTKIAFHDEGSGPPVILLHGFGVDGLGQFGEFERILPLLEKRQAMFPEVFGAAPPIPDPPQAGRPGVVRVLQEAGARTILPDMRGFGASDKPSETAAYADSAMARDVVALINHPPA